jgi:hypothetical protein
MRQYNLLLAGALVTACGGNPSGGTPSPSRTPAPPSPPSSQPSSDAVRQAAATITPADILDRLTFLASDELKGRNTPSPGLETAAKYVADQLRSYGLTSGVPDGSFIQRWPYRSSAIDPARTFIRARTPKGTVTANFATDFFVLPAQADSSTGALVWAGVAQPGREALPASLAGKVVALFVPGASVGSEWQQAVQTGIVSAMAAGPAAVLLVLDPAFPDDAVGQLAGEVAGQVAPLHIAGVRYVTAKAMFTSAGSDLDALSASASTAPVAIANTTVTIGAGSTATETNPPNVVAVLRGSDPALRDTYVVFSAHIDHVGVGSPDASGDSIYNGADDDASGTTTILEVAQAFASMPTRPARSLIFLGVSGEEKGLFGSDYFSQNPTVPIGSSVADINIDMVGRNAPDTVVAIGQEYSSLGPTVQRIIGEHPELGLVVAPDLWPEEGLFFRSDHFSFAKRGVPSIFFTTGLHDDYHKPSDEIDTIDTDKMARIGKLVFYLGNAVAGATTAPAWTEKGRAEIKAMTGN